MSNVIIGRNDASGLTVETINDSGNKVSANKGPFIASYATIALQSGVQEGENQRVTVQLIDQNGDNVARVTPIRVWISEGTGIGVGPYATTGMLPVSGSGTILVFPQLLLGREITFSNFMIADGITNASGVFAVDIVALDFGPLRYFNVSAEQAIAKSAALTPTAQG